MDVDGAGAPTHWARWGRPEQTPVLSKAAQTFLARRLGAGQPSEVAELEDVAVPPSRLTEAARSALCDAVGPENLRRDAESRLRHGAGQSYTDLVRRRAGRLEVPDAVVLPGTAEEVGAVLRACAATEVAVVPFGGGTSVVGGVEPSRGRFPAVIALDLGRMNRLLAVDPLSLTATFEPGITTPAADAALAHHGLTLGHFPQSYERATIGGYVATRSAGQASTGYGRIDDRVLGLRLTTPAGDLILPAQPASAAGPDLRRWAVGSEGVFGVITEATLRVHRTPRARHYEAWIVDSFVTGRELFREFAQEGLTADVMRLSDEEETRVGLALTGPRGLARHALAAYLSARRRRGGCLVILGFEGTAAGIGARRGGMEKLLRAGGAVALGSRAGRSWEHGRFAGPYLRDALLDHGWLVETLETAALWSTLPSVYEAAGAALRSALRSALVGCHISHVYPTGASLYFTVLAARRPGVEIADWDSAKTAASEALVAAGATVSHHHAVGSTHAPWLEAETSALGVASLRAVKDRLDPVGIMNPGKLLPG